MTLFIHDAISSDPFMVIFMPKKDLEYEVVKRIAALLLASRESQKISKRELSQRTGVSRTAIRTIENGERQPSVYILLKICKGLEVDLWKMLKDAGTSE